MAMLMSRFRQKPRSMNQGPAIYLSHVSRDLQLQSMLTVILVVTVSPGDQEQDFLSFSMYPISTVEVRNNRIVK